MNGYLEVIDSNQKTNRWNWILLPICLGGLISLFIWYSKRKPIVFEQQKSIQPEIIEFQSRYEYS